MIDFGIKIIEDRELIIKGSQFRFPRSKKKRIRTKWSKIDSNYRYLPDPNFYYDEIHKLIYCHPSSANLLRDKISEKRIN